jgi:excisionase family DNA binding protein
MWPCFGQWGRRGIRPPQQDREKSGAVTSTQRVHRRSPSRVTPVAIEPEASRMALSVPQAAWLLGTSPNFVWGILAKGELGSFHLGRKRMIARSEVERFIAAGGTHNNDFGSARSERP